jgi:hypothetical protein
MTSEYEDEVRDTRLELIKTNWKDLIWWRNVALAKFVQPLMELRNHGTYLLDETWDSLVVLDACRYDIFRDSIPGSNLHGTLSSRTSRATDTPPFLVMNFVDRKSDDIVYVSANPFADKFIKDRVYKLISVWRTNWNEENDTVLPEAMYERTVEAAEKYPDKRIVAHFIQPHYPYIGHKELNVSKLLSARPEKNQVKGGGYRDTSFFTLCAKRIDAGAMKNTGKYLEAYAENLRLVFPYLEKLVRILPGRTVITADHGEAFGEKINRLLPIRVYGHMPSMRIKSLTEVPWFVIEREQKIAEYSTAISNAASNDSLNKEPFDGGEEEELNRRLKSLGYS